MVGKGLQVAPHTDHFRTVGWKPSRITLQGALLTGLSLLVFGSLLPFIARPMRVSMLRGGHLLFHLTGLLRRRCPPASGSTETARPSPHSALVPPCSHEQAARRRPRPSFPCRRA